MCADCAWRAALIEIEEALVEVDDLPPAAFDFADSVQEKLESIAIWIDDNQHVTEAQKTAINNMRGGIDNWKR